MTEAARRREDGRSWRQIAAVWMHDGGDVPTERGDLAWRDIFADSVATVHIYFWCAPTTYWLELEYIFNRFTECPPG